MVVARRDERAVRRVGKAFLDAFRAMLANEAPGAAAAISYFSLLALFPAILVLIAAADAFLGSIDLRDRVLQSILSLFPGSRSFIRSNFEEITAPSPHIVVSCMVIVVWSSTWVFVFVENALNRAWGVSKRRTFWQSRVRSFALLSLSGILLLTSAGITGAVSAFRSAADRRIPEFAQDQIIDRLWSWLLVSAGFLIAILVFLMVYKLMPDRKVLWVEALSGAIASAVLWEIASYVFVKLVPLFNYQRVYGRMGAIVALLTWVYTSSTIMLFGATFSAQLHQPDCDQETLSPGFGKPSTTDKRVHVFSPR